MHPQQSQQEKGMQQPRNVVVEWTGNVAVAGLPCHGWDQKQVDDPSDQEQPEGKEVEDTEKAISKVKPMGTDEAKNPQQITHNSGVLRFIRVCTVLVGSGGLGVIYGRSVVGVCVHNTSVRTGDVFLGYNKA